MRSALRAIVLLVIACTATASGAQPYTVTKYDDSTFAKACYASLAPFQGHFDGAVSDGEWGICGFSDRTQRVGPGSVLHNSALFRTDGGTWKFYQKGNGYFTVAELEEIGVPVDAAQRLATAFKVDVCLRGDVPATKWYCDKQ
jgi:hypothetical protein